MYKKVLPPPRSQPDVTTADGPEAPLSTKERIFRLALSYFNENGIEYVGIRELARELGLSPGNVSYYFPTKEALVLEIAMRLSQENSKAFEEAGSDLTLKRFMELFRSTFSNHYRYRCLMMSAVHVMKHFDSIASAYKKTQARRLPELKKDLQELQKSGELVRTLKPADLNYLVAAISHTARYWVPEAMINFAEVEEDEIVAHYVGMIASTLHPYAGDRGRQVLKPYMSGILKVV